MPIIRSMEHVFGWSYGLCRPDFELTDYWGYLRKYEMVSLKRLDPISENFSIVIFTPKKIKCQTNTKAEHYFLLKARLKQHKTRIVRFKVTVACEGF